jgi:hypothetical protein
MKKIIKLVGTEENIERAIAELESSIQYENLEVKIENGI